MKLFLTLAALTLLTACSTSGTSILLSEETTYSSTTSASIELLIEAPEREHQIFALVEGTAATDDYLTKKRTKEAAVTALKKEAARIGADAVILSGTSSQEYEGLWDKIHVKGKALKYTDK